MSDKVNRLESLGMNMPSEDEAEEIRKVGKELLDKLTQEELDRQYAQAVYEPHGILKWDTQQPGVSAQIRETLERPNSVVSAAPPVSAAGLVDRPPDATQQANVINTDNIDMREYARQRKAAGGAPHELHKLRKADSRPGLFKHHGKYGVDRQLARKAFELRTTAKPRWAVVGCVWLRAGGLCEVCTETIDMSAVVRQLQLHKNGGSFNELNCLLVCRYCDKVWPVRTMFDTGVNTLTLADLVCAILAKRNKGAQGSKYLTDKAHSHWHKQRALQERLRLALQLEVENALNGVVIKSNESTSKSCLLV